MSQTQKEMQNDIQEIYTELSHEKAYNEAMNICLPKQNKYLREIKPDVLVDVYDVLKSFEVTNQATAHAVKKLLAAGQRGHKDLLQDLKEARDSINRAIELETE